jgi:hypothetical protein
VAFVAATASLLMALMIVAAVAHPPPGADPNSPEAEWYRAARTPQCWGCCDVADGRPVLARRDDSSPLGWAVLIDGTWTPIPGETRATQCETKPSGFGWIPVGNYPVNPAGHAVVWLYNGRIRCFSPPGSGI